MVVRSRSTRRRGLRRAGFAALLVAMVLVGSGCRVTVGCRTYSLWEPGTPTPWYVDDTSCNQGPPPVVPEAPLAVLLPVAGAAAVLLVGRRQVTRRRREGGSR